MSNQVKKAPAAVTAEIKRLKELKPSVRKFSSFGDNNHRYMEVQIETLERGLDEDGVYSQGWTQDEESNAINAIAWRNGEAEESLFDDWKTLATGASHE